MLLEFTVGNYLSFKDRKTLSLEASSITEFPQNVIDLDNFELLRSAVIYGANSSGKSNFLSALTKMRKIVIESGKQTSTDKIEVSPFLLNTETEKCSSYFEILFLIDGIRYRYGFEIDTDVVHSEWLYVKRKDKETELFTRVNGDIDVSKNFTEGTGLEKRTRDNGLFLSTVDQFNGAISNKIMKWFDNYIILSGVDHQKNRSLSIALMKDNGFKSRFTKFICDFNLGFSGITTNDDNNTDNNLIITHHNKYDVNNELIGSIPFSLISHESSGTNKLFDMAGYIWLGLRVGTIVIIDELDAKLHPLITQAIVKLFNSPESNPNNAQLIFATHDTNLLNYAGLRRDQIYFTEKDQYEATDLYSLVEYKDDGDKKIRKDRSFEKDYIEGRYGAIPFVGGLTKLFSNG